MKIRTMHTCALRCAVIVVAVLGAAGPGPANAGEAVPPNRVIKTPLHVFTVDDIGLPAQVEIVAAIKDLPLAFRTLEEKKRAPVVKMISRGPQFAKPMRIEAMLDKALFSAKADAPTTLNKTDKGTEAASAWQAGALKGRLQILYAEDGSMTGRLTYDATGTNLERLDLVMEIDGDVDTVIAGNPADLLTGKEALGLAYGTLASSSGIVWSDGAVPVGDGAGQKGLIRHFFLGNGDRGFTWLPHGEEGFTVKGKEPSMIVEREKKGETVVWKIAIVNQAPGGGEHTAGFTLLVHPSRAQPADRRIRQWQKWPEKALTPALDVASRGAVTGDNVLVRAEAGSVCEAFAARALLEGPIGGDALTKEATLADRYPLALFRYLAASHTGLAVQLRSNGGALSKPGGSLAVDNMILGRALAHDIGVDVASLASRAYAADVVNALEAFGYFKKDGMTEFLPYWRAENFGIGLVRYGEAFEEDAKKGFALTTENPAGRVRVSVFLRPSPEKQEKPTRKALMVLVNESDKPVRELLYVENPLYLFGSENKINSVNVLAMQDTSSIPNDSDWRREEAVKTQPMSQGDIKVAIKLRTQKEKAVNAKMVVGCLQDLITNGYVRTSKMGGNPAPFALFGPLYIPARGMRLLVGAGALEGGVFGTVWKVTKEGKRTPVASAPVYVFTHGDVPVVEEIKQSKFSYTSLRTGEDGTFRLDLAADCPSHVTVVTEVDGKLYPDRQVMERRKEGVVATWPPIPLKQTVKVAKITEEYCWADCSIEVLEGNSSPKFPEGPAKPEEGKPWTAPYTGIEFVWIPPGEFEMGSPESEAGRSKNETLHHVTISKGFWMSKYEITQGQFMRTMGENPSKFKYAGDKAPVENMIYQVPGRFAAKLNELARGTGVRFLVPTEAQWEYACRAGSKTALYNNGPLTIKGAYNGPELNEIAWYGGNSGIQNALAFDTRKWRDRQFESPWSGTHPVGQKKPNAFGLYDMLGNVAEWTADQYSEDLGTDAVTDPFVPPDDPLNIRLGFRGGAWCSMPSFCRAACRQGDQWPGGEFPPPYDSSEVGVRLVCVVNHEPTVTLAASATEGTAPLTVDFTATAADPDGDPLRYAWTFGEKKRVDASDPKASYTYSKFGTFTATVSVMDGRNDPVSQQVKITVTRGANRVPVVEDQSVSARQNAPKGIRLLATDDDDDVLTYIIVTPPAHGELAGKGANLSYNPAKDYIGPDSFTYKVTDSFKGKDGKLESSESNMATVSINVITKEEEDKEKEKEKEREKERAKEKELEKQKAKEKATKKGK